MKVDTIKTVVEDIMLSENIPREQFARILRITHRVLNELKFRVDVSREVKEFTISGALTVKLPDKAIDVGRVKIGDKEITPMEEDFVADNLCATPIPTAEPVTVFCGGIVEENVEGGYSYDKGAGVIRFNSSSANVGDKVLISYSVMDGGERYVRLDAYDMVRALVLYKFFSNKKSKQVTYWQEFKMYRDMFEAENKKIDALDLIMAIA